MISRPSVAARTAPVVLATLVALAVQAPGQVLVEELPGLRRVIEVGDVDGDGVTDRAAVDGDGKVRIILGQSGHVTLTYTPTTLGENSIAAPGDVNGDGRPDLILGEPGYGGDGSGRVLILDLLTGSPLGVTFGGAGPGAALGSSLILLPDLNGDGVPDAAAGAPRWVPGENTSGQVVLLSGDDGHELASFGPPGVAPGGGPNRFGHDLALADVTGDGVPELVVAMPREPGTESLPRVQAFELATLVAGGDALVLDLVGPLAGWAESLACAGDVDGDGRDDLLVGAPEGVEPFGSANPGLPRALLVSGADGAPLAEFLAPEPTSGFGSDVAGVGDLDLDGVPDLLVAGPGSGFPLGLGRAVVFSGADGGVLFDIIGLTGEEGAFAESVDVFADVTGDGVTEFQVRDDFEGLVRIYSGLGVIETFGLALAGAAGKPELSAEGSLLPGSPLALDLVRAPPLAPVFFVLGFGLSSTRFLGGIMGPETVEAITGYGTDGAGEFFLEARWPVGLPSATIYVQAWMLDPTGPQGASASNALGLSPP